MKKALLLLSFLFTTVLYAQNNRNLFPVSTDKKFTADKIYQGLKSFKDLKIASVSQIVDSIYYWHWDLNNSVLEAGHRTYLTYDANNNVSMEIWQFYDSNGDWTNKISLRMLMM